MRTKSRNVRRRSPNNVLPRRRIIAQAVTTHLQSQSVRLATMARATALGLTIGMSAPAGAATFSVINNNDAGPGSLRQAVIDANNNPGLDDINFAVSGTITLISGSIDITDSVNIHGPGSNLLTIDGGGVSWMFRDALPIAAEVTIAGLTLTNASLGALAFGGGGTRTVQDSVITGNNNGVLADYPGVEDLFIQNTTISNNFGNGVSLFEVSNLATISNSTISGNLGSGIAVAFNAYPVNIHIDNTVIADNQFAGVDAPVGNVSISISNSTISDNQGGGVYAATADFAVTVSDSTISGNVAPWCAGLNLPFGTVVNSTITGNTATDFGGGGVCANFGNFSLVNSTVSGNTAATRGGGVSVRIPDNSPYSNAIVNSTIVNNSAERMGGVETVPYYREIELRNTVIAGNTASQMFPDVAGAFTADYNLIQDLGPSVLNESVPGSNMIGVAAELGPLQDNGGATETHALLSSSPAIDAGDPSFTAPPDFDQRGAGHPRVVGGRIDIGAYEQQGTAQIGDRVWADLNGDGVQDAGEPGAAGVTVRLRDCGGNVIATTATDGNGHYRFSGLGAGSRQLEFVAPAGSVLSPPLQGTKRGKDSDPDPGTGLTNCQFTPDGKVRLGIDAGLIAQAAGTGQLGDRTWNDLNGDGIQDPGEPGLGGVTVRLLDCNGNELTTTSSDPNGGYLFTGLAAGQYQLEFVSPPGLALSPALQGPKRGKDSNPDPATGVTACISIADGQSRLGIDAGFSGQAAGTGSIGDYVWHDSNGDGVQDAAESGLPGVTVNLQDCGGGQLDTTTTDSNGAYLFGNLLPGSYRINFEAPAGFGFSPARQSTGGKDSDPDPATGTTSCKPLADGQSRLGIDAGLND